MPLIRVDVIDLRAVCCAYLSGVGAIDCVWVSVGGGYACATPRKTARTRDALTYADCGDKAKESGVFLSDCRVIDVRGHGFVLFR